VYAGGIVTQEAGDSIHVEINGKAPRVCVYRHTYTVEREREAKECHVYIVIKKRDKTANTACNV
jgi:hypothetical protein